MITNLDIMTIRDMNFYGYHGVFPAENQLGQRFTVHLQGYLDISPAAEADDLILTANYAAVFDEIGQVVQEERYQLLETLAVRIAQVVLARFAVFQGVTVEVVKEHAPIPQFNGTVSVRITRMRE